MFTKILVALDGSDHAQQALQTAAKLAQRCQAQLVLFHALQLRALRADYEAVVSKAAREAYLTIGKEQADAILSQAEQEAISLGATALTRLTAEGEPAAAILNAAKEGGVDLLVMGTRGLTGLRELAMGSVAHKVTSAAHCPVLVVR